mgnify:CR=1 FL=1
MESINLQKQFEQEQYRNQSNLVYYSTMVISTLIAMIYLLVVKSTMMSLMLGILVLASGVAVWLNSQSRYGISAFVYIAIAMMVSIVEVNTFGLEPGFQFVYFNLAGLITFTNWKPIYKLVGEVVNIVIFITVFLLIYDKVPPIVLSHEMIRFFYITNILLNITGVANSANYYITIATKAHKKISALAMRDYLTNLMNRSSFDDYMKEICASPNTEGLAILMIDLDHFKSINDTYGHQFGDELLRRFADILRESTRISDCAARYGGEEFVLVAKIQQSEQVIDLAERLRTQLETSKFDFNGKTIQVTLSIGALFIPPYYQLKADEAIRQADTLLYKAKNEGRNRVAFDQVHS